MRLIDADALIEAYDRTHEGEPGKARQLILDAPTIEERRTDSGMATFKEIPRAVENLPSAQPQDIAQDIARIIENEKDMRVISKNAQPEIIRCKDCRYSIDEYGDGECYCKRPSRELVWIGKRWDFFCAAARLKMEVEHE